MRGQSFGDSDGSRFYWALVDNAIAEDADFGFYPHDASGSFYVALTTDPSDRARRALSSRVARTFSVGRPSRWSRTGRAGSGQGSSSPSRPAPESA